MSVVGLLFILICYCAVALIAAIWVAIDSKRRDMNGLVWGLITFFMPVLIGFLIYMIIRNPIITLKCPKCKEILPKNTNMCPSCGTEVNVICSQCKTPIKKGYTICHNCGERFDENVQQPIRVYEKNKGTLVIVVIISVIAIAFAGVFGLLMIPVSSYVTHTSESYSGNFGMYNIKKEDMLKNKTIKDWIEKSDKSDKMVNVLLDKEGNCLVYVKGSSKLLEDEITVELSENKYKLWINIRESEYEDKYGYDFFMYKVDYKKKTSVNASFNDKDVDVAVTVSDESIDTETWR